MMEMSKRLALPADVLAGIPRIEVIGSTELRIEPHRGLLEYGTEQVTIRTDIGAISILGTELQITLMNSQCLVINGRLESLDLRGNGNG